jgi:allophanate hydrolase subunit 2
MRYVTILGFMIALGLVIYLSAARLAQSTPGPGVSYNAATQAAQKAAGAAQQHVQDVLKNMRPGSP